MDQLFELGRHTALRIWADDADAPAIADPRDPEFARGVMVGLTASLSAAPGLMRRVVGHAAAAAEDLNVEAFQGLVEVLQNADDLGARSVRFALSGGPDARRLSIVHDGAPVTCHHVLAMTLPYLTTKSGDAEQKGRFGIGLKTLRRISSRIAIHSAPYHFSADGLDLISVAAADALPGFYDPSADTLLELDLVSDFSPEALEEWFGAWEEDGLLFLRSVQRFAWRDLVTGVERARTVEPKGWEDLPVALGLPPLQRRSVVGGSGSWTVFRAEVETPANLDRSHKATGTTTAISVALADHDHPAGLFIGFRTRIPVTLPFIIDAQFDPSTAREGLIENAWNKWLIGRCGEVLTAIGLTLLRREPRVAWALIAIADEGVGLPGDRWPRAAFDEALAETRSQLSRSGAVLIGDAIVDLGAIAYEGDELDGLASPEDVLLLCPDKTPLTVTERDDVGRWRDVLDTLAVSTRLGTDELVAGFVKARFGHKPVDWWIAAGARLAEVHPDEDIFGTPCWLTDQGTATACSRRGATERPLLIGEPASDFARRWSLFEHLHEDYKLTDLGQVALNWLNTHAAVAATVDAANELEAFAEFFADKPFAIEDADLALIRDRFDLLTDRRAEPLGPKVGKALLLDGFVYRNGKRADIKTSPVTAYLSRTLDSDHPYWPDAAGTLPGITWLASSYDLRLKTGATRSARKRADGTISRAARKFLMLLGAVCSPRIVTSGRKNWGAEHRTMELRAIGAEFVETDHTSPDLDRVLASLERSSKKDRKTRSAALIKAFSRYWETYTGQLKVPAYHQATKYRHPKGEVAADWVCRLHDSHWVAVGAGNLRPPSESVVRTVQTQALYTPEDFIAGVSLSDVSPGFAATLKIITDVRASDLVTLIEQSRSAADGFDPVRVQNAYRSLAKLCPNPVGWNSRVGDLALSDLKQRFSADSGLIWVPSRDGRWRRPDELFVGKDIFLDPGWFVPGGPSCHDLWNALGVRRPTLDACITVLRSLAEAPYSSASEAVLIEVYRYIEPIVAKAERRLRERIRALPVGVGGAWSTSRPVYRVLDRELGAQLAEARPDLRFWSPPCDTHTLPNVCAALGLTTCAPAMDVPLDSTASDLGEVVGPHFRRCVEHLSNELARNEPALRDRIGVPWKNLRDTTLFVHGGPFDVLVTASELSTRPIQVRMRAVLQIDPLRLHVDEHALSRRENCGRAVASLFPADAQRRIEAEWVASWVASDDAPVEMMATASDEALERALADRAAATALSPGAKIKVSSPASRDRNTLPPRKLKAAHGGVTKVTVVPAGPAKGAAPPRAPLADTPPPPPPPPPNGPTAPVEYDTIDLEQRGWEILRGILNTSDEIDLVDFRRRHRVGADGVIDWKTFVELKATGRGPQGSVEMSASEFERAKERGLDFMIALVSGLEEGHQTEVRLILDPANRATVRPIGSVRLVGLADAPAVVMQLGDAEDDDRPGSVPGPALQHPVPAAAER